MSDEKINILAEFRNVISKLRNGELGATGTARILTRLVNDYESLGYHSESADPYAEIRRLIADLAENKLYPETPKWLSEEVNHLSRLGIDAPCVVESSVG